MKEKHAKEWQQERQKGVLRWTVMRGLLGYGVPMAIFFGVTNYRLDLTKILILVLGTIFVGGTLFGLFLWHFNERSYQRYLFRHGLPPD